MKSLISKLSVTFPKFAPLYSIAYFILAGCGDPNTEQTIESTQVPEGSLTEQLDFITKKGNYTTEDKRLNDLFEAYTSWQYESSPLEATYRGNNDYNDSWGDFSPSGNQKYLEESEQFYKAKESFDKEWLNGDNRLNYDIYNRIVESFHDLNGQFDEQYFIIEQQGGVHLYLPSILQLMPKNSEEDFNDMLVRLSKIPQVFVDIQATLEEAIQKDIMMPRNTLAQVPAQLKSLMSDNPTESAFYSNFSDIPEDTGVEDPKQLQKQAQETITEEVNPALEKFMKFIETQYIPNCRETYGLSELPNGEEWYNQRIKSYTTTNMTAIEIHELGVSEVARINAEMLEIKDRVNFKGSLEEFNEFLRTDSQFYFDTPDELLKEYRDICKRVDAELVKLFGHLPRLPYGVKAIPSYSEQTATTAYYNQGSIDNGIPGYFFANTYNLKSRPKWEMEALSIHEAVPGHHLQIAIAQELENVPVFRTNSTFTGFVEGWGLYSESLGPELGMYTDPYSKYGQLTYEMWRAIRLVVDTGIHAFGWSREEAIAYFTANSSKSEHDITVEIDRYIAWPGQALAYKIGELKIKELRKRAKDTLGDEFDIREFHDQVLGGGAVPLDILESNIDRWVKSKAQTDG
ncbi:MAG: DUF885 domain-containing protein [Cytophagales bacterium]|nr:DUF885 domain-containing protein [Cytophagales bacterium]